MSKVLKGILIVLIVAYIISPVDFCMGPIDDVILLLFTVCGGLATRKIENKGV